MLSKKDLINKAHHLIRNKKMSHQEVYDLLKKETSGDPKEDIAELVSKVPNDRHNRETKGLRIIFIICMSLIFIIRIADLILEINNLNFFSVVIFIFHGLILPPLGIYSALTSRTRYYRFIGFFMIISSVAYVLILAFIITHWIIAVLALPFIGSAILGFLLPSKLKVAYKKRMVQREIHGRTVNVYEYFFQEPQTLSSRENSDLLDV